MNSQRVTARAAVPSQSDRVDLRAMFDKKTRRFGGPPIKEGAGGHVCQSGEQEFARILPYPPPGKALGAKTNHLPNIQGQKLAEALQDGVSRKFFGAVRTFFGAPRDERKLILSSRPETEILGWNQGVPGVDESEPDPRDFAAYRPKPSFLLANYSAAARAAFGSAADSMKSQMRGTISDLKREPLNTP